MKNLKTKEKINASLIENREDQFQAWEFDLFSSSIQGTRAWAQFQEHLTAAESSPEYWDKQETQTQLIELSKFCERTFSEIKQDLDQDLKTKLADFLERDLQECFEVSWDRDFAFGNFLRDPAFEELESLYPEDIFGMLVMLDRTLLFLKETLRQKKYKRAQYQIDTINDVVPPQIMNLSSFIAL